MGSSPDIEKPERRPGPEVCAAAGPAAIRQNAEIAAAMSEALSVLRIVGGAFCCGRFPRFRRVGRGVDLYALLKDQNLAVFKDAHGVCDYSEAVRLDVDGILGR